MRRLIITIMVLGLLFCAETAPCREGPENSASEQLPDASLPAELERVLRDYERAWQAGDASALSKLFAEDGFVLQSHRLPIRGRRAIAAAYEATFKGKGGGPLRLRALAYSAENQSGYIIGAYSYDGAKDIGKFTLTLRRLPGQHWLIFSDMDNQNVDGRRSDSP